MVEGACEDREMQVRSMRYRMQRLGMLELEAWLGRLLPAIDGGDEAVIDAALQMMQSPTPELLAMMHAELPLPEVLRPLLEARKA